MEEGGGLGTRLSLVRSFANSVTLLGSFQLSLNIEAVHSISLTSISG